MYINENVKKYIEDLAARKPAPGGGSAAALSGALGVALLEMVCNFTLGGEKYKDVEGDIQKNLTSLKTHREQFEKLIDEDVEVYSKIRDAFKTKDKFNIDRALKKGYRICFTICKLSKESIEIALDLSSKGNPNLITDVGCGAELIYAANKCGVFNAKINLKGIEDAQFTQKENSVLEDLGKEIENLYNQTTLKTKERMK